MRRECGAGGGHSAHQRQKVRNLRIPHALWGRSGLGASFAAVRCMQAVNRYICADPTPAGAPRAPARGLSSPPGDPP